MKSQKRKKNVFRIFKIKENEVVKNLFEMRKKKSSLFYENKY